MSRRLAILAMLALPFSGGANAAPPERSAVLAKAAEAAEVCVQNMPNSQATTNALKAHGFGLADANGPLKAYTAISNRVAVIISSPSRSSEACVIGVGKLSEAEAMQLLKPWLSSSETRPIPVNGNFTRAWTGRFKGRPVDIAISRTTDLYYFTGRTIMVRAAQNP